MFLRRYRPRLDSELIAASPTTPACAAMVLALPDFRGVISTADGAKVLVSFTGRTVFVPRGNQTVGRRLLLALLESDDEQYAWRNSPVGIAKGVHDPQNPPSRTEVYLCTNDLV